ncbi:unnamed protein product [Arctia plantaginis]|uniref:Uncharacterized protein n=1 Tax=Arctia plantaginis TaxID=874455 RepID=A0A8S0ZHQ6_ARCPL|nr:unnamed protein product [Arctia plantaginis]
MFWFVTFRISVNPLTSSWRLQNSDVETRHARALPASLADCAPSAGTRLARGRAHKAHLPLSSIHPSSHRCIPT